MVLSWFHTHRKSLSPHPLKDEIQEIFVQRENEMWFTSHQTISRNSLDQLSDQVTQQMNLLDWSPIAYSLHSQLTTKINSYLSNNTNQLLASQEKTRSAIHEVVAPDPDLYFKDTLAPHQQQQFNVMRNHTTPESFKQHLTSFSEWKKNRKLMPIAEMRRLKKNYLNHQEFLRIPDWESDVKAYYQMLQVLKMMKQDNYISFPSFSRIYDEIKNSFYLEQDQASNSTQSQAVFLSWLHGVGKSTLAEHILRDITWQEPTIIKCHADITNTSLQWGYQPNAQGQYEFILQWLQKAAKEWRPVILDEADKLDYLALKWTINWFMDKLKKKWQTVMTEWNSWGNYTVWYGFMIVWTCNYGASFERMSYEPDISADNSTKSRINFQTVGYPNKQELLYYITSRIMDKTGEVAWTNTVPATMNHIADAMLWFDDAVKSLSSSWSSELQPIINRIAGFSLRELETVIKKSKKSNFKDLEYHLLGQIFNHFFGMNHRR